MTPVAMITGAARGIGQAAAVALAKQGFDLAICDLQPAGNPPETVRLVRETGRQAFYQRCDVSSREQVETFFAGTLQSLGRLDVLVNNAALNIRKPLVELEVEDVARVWAVSQWGVFHCSQLAARQMIRQGNGGVIIVISSVHAEQPYACSTSYNGAKAAVNQMARTWAVELAPHRIRVNAIEPGWTDTPGERTFFTEEQIQEEGRKLPLGRLARPDEIAAAVCFLASDQAAYITGSILRVDGGIVLPR